MPKNYEELYAQLKESYSEKNLNDITANIIEFYKSRQFDSIRQITKIVSEFNDIADKNISKCFSKLIMIYHPDKVAYYNGELDKLYAERNLAGLNQYAHILIVQDYDHLPVTPESLEDIDYSPEYGIDFDQEENAFVDDSEFVDEQEEDGQPYGYNSGFMDEDNSFYNAVKRKIYGSRKVDLPSYYLEDFEEIEMAEYEIDDLAGVEYCIHVTNLDLSKNQITDLSPLWSLIKLEELYLSDNQIGYIDALSNLRNLRIVDLSYNQLDDISPLFELEHLEYVNVMGNKIPFKQIDILISKDVIVIS
jgi:hypothetical protein